MLEEIRLMSSPVTSVKLATRRGIDIDNTIAPPVGERESRVYAKFRDTFGQHWELRKDACGVYNCFGHVFACRRTAIYDEKDTEIVKILEHDGYRRLTVSDPAMPDDVVLYRQSKTTNIVHVGRIAKVLPSPTQILGLSQGCSSTHNVYVVSKWGDSTGEDVHNIRDVPYPKQGIEIEIEVWTDRT